MKTKSHTSYFTSRRKIGIPIEASGLHTSSSRGFTLVEMLVAILLLSFGIAGPFTVASQSIASSRYARDQVTAYNLAQEAMEYVRNLRDNRSLASEDNDDWLKSLTDDGCVGGVGSCIVDTLRSTPNDILPRSGGNEVLYLAADGMSYGHQPTANLSPFKRFFTVVETNPDDEALITVTVVWQRGSLPTRTVILRDRLLNWQP